MTSTLIKGAIGIMTGLKGPAGRRTGDIRVAGGRIAALGDLSPLPGERVIDAAGCVVYPGLVSTHHHLFQSMLKGIPAGLHLPLFGWLREVPFSHWNRLDREAMEVGATVGIAELLLSGATTIADHHYMFAAHDDFDPADLLFGVAARFGVRFVLCRGGQTKTRTFDTPDILPMPTEPLDAMIRGVERAAQRHHDPAPDAMKRVVFAPTTPPWSVDQGELKEIAQAARGLGLRLHSHLSETTDYVKWALDVHGKRPIHWIADHGWLGPDVWFAHLVHMEEDEIRILAETGTGMAHCPQSNCRLGSGTAPADILDRMGGTVSVAVDGAGSNEAADMISEMHAAWHVHRAAKGADAVSVDDVVRWSTAGGAKVLGLPSIGTIEVGQQADLAVFDLTHPRYAGLHDPLIGPVASAGTPHLRCVMVAGRTVVEEGAIPGLDMAALAARARDVVARVARR